MPFSQVTPHRPLDIHPPYFDTCNMAYYIESARNCLPRAVHQGLISRRDAQPLYNNLRTAERALEDKQDCFEFITLLKQDALDLGMERVAREIGWSLEEHSRFRRVVQKHHRPRRFISSFLKPLYNHQRRLGIDWDGRNRSSWVSEISVRMLKDSRVFRDKPALESYSYRIPEYIDKPETDYREGFDYVIENLPFNKNKRHLRFRLFVRDIQALRRLFRCVFDVQQPQNKSEYKAFTGRKHIEIDVDCRQSYRGAYNLKYGGQYAIRHFATKAGYVDIKVGQLKKDRWNCHVLAKTDYLVEIVP